MNLKKLLALTSSALLITAALPLSASAEVLESNINYKEYVGTIQNPAAGYTNTVWSVCKPGDTPIYSPKAGEKFTLFFIDIGAFSSGINDEKDYDLDNVFFSSWYQTFANCRRNGTMVALRFRYDANGNDNPEPKSFDKVLEHISQIKKSKLLESNSDIICFVESGFVGKWGEQHGGKYVTADYKAKLLQAMLEAVPENIPVTVRTPDIFAEWAGIERKSLNDTELINSLESSRYCPDIQKYKNRVGLYDDGYMGSDSDLGTYADREKETEWLGNQTLTSYFGGEFSGDIDFAKRYETYLPENAIPEMYKTHLSYINGNIFKLYEDYTFGKEYDVENVDNSAYYGQSVFQFIRDHIGYRFVLRNSHVYDKVPQGDKLYIDFDVENTGFSSLHPFDRAFVIIEKDGVYYATSVETDPRKWLSCTYNSEHLELKLPDNIATGKYNVYLALNLIDSAVSGSFVQFANEGIWNPMLNGNYLGSFEVTESETHGTDYSFRSLNYTDYELFSPTIYMGRDAGFATHSYEPATPMTYREITVVDGKKTFEQEWSEDMKVSENEGQDLSVKADSKYLYIKSTMPEGSSAPVYNLELNVSNDDTSEHFWLYYASNGFVYFDHKDYSGCQCKWEGDTVEFRLPLEKFNLKSGSTIDSLRVFLQDSGNEWKLMGDIRAYGVKVISDFEVYSVPYEIKAENDLPMTILPVMEIVPTGDIKYTWYLNGEEIPKANQEYYTVKPNADTAGTYSVKIAVNNGVEKTVDVATILVDGAEEKPKGNIGDANCDGKVSAADATAILQALGNPDRYELTEQGKINADVYGNNDGITPMDALTIQQVDAGIYTVDQLPIK